MNKRFAVILLAACISSLVFAKENLDTAVYNASIDIITYCEKNSVIVVDDFTSPSKNLTLYIREQLADVIFSNSRTIKIVTRDRMGIVEKELKFQNSGVADVDSIISVAGRLGASSIVFGSFDEFDSGYALRVQMLDVKTGAYLFRKTYSF